MPWNVSAVAHGFSRFARVATEWTGSTPAFVLAAAVILAWVASGPVFNYSDTWQLVINTGTTIVTFLMVFLIQRSQNRDSVAVHLKLNELIAAVKGASNTLIGAEDLSEEDITALRLEFQRLAVLAKADRRPGGIHSVAEVAKKVDAVAARVEEVAHATCDG